MKGSFRLVFNRFVSLKIGCQVTLREIILRNAGGGRVGCRDNAAGIFFPDDLAFGAELTGGYAKPQLGDKSVTTS